MIQVIVEIVTKPGQRDAYLKAFHDNVGAVHNEKGCIEYSAFVDIEGAGPPQVPYGPNTIIVIEKWESGADLRAHAKADHMTTYQAKVKDFIESRTIRLLAQA